MLIDQLVKPMKFRWLSLFFVLPSSALLAAPVQITITAQDNQPLADAVVELIAPSYPQLTKKTIEVAQKDLVFQPFVTAVQAGSAVEFPNQDKTRHHVYSFSPAKVFELKLYAGKPEAPVMFEKPGIVAIGCNIHDYMQAYVYVGESPLLAVSDEQGNVSFADIPAGDYQLKIWHPWQLQEFTPKKITLPLTDSGFQLSVTRQAKPSKPKKGFGESYL